MSSERTRLPFARWLAILISLLLLVPVGAGATAWVIARDVQTNQQRSLVRAAERVFTRPQPLSHVWLAAAVARLQRLGVSAHLESSRGNQPARAPSVPSRKTRATGTNNEQPTPQRRTGATRDLATPNFKPANAPTATNANRYQPINIHERHLVANLLIPRGNPAVPWLAALVSAMAALLAVIVAASAAVRRCVARPLARLASGAEQIAAGDLEIDRVLSPVREITIVGEAQHGMARSLAETVHAARAADHERHFLITAIAHDLRTPLFTLRGSLEALELGIGDQGALPRAQQKAALLDRLVSDLFTFSRLEYATEPHRQRRFDIRETVQHAVDSIATDVRTVVVELPDESAILHSDETAVARILTNLLDNAIRHAHERVHLRVQHVHDGVEVEVSDDGPGFAAHALAQIFDPFYQADSARSRNGGAGLGLTIVHRLATALGGNVTATNLPDSGALVVVTLPTTEPTRTTSPGSANAPTDG